MHLNRRQFIEVASGAAVLLPAERQPPTEDRDDPLGVRRDFPAARDGLYLNAAYIAPVPLQVADAARLVRDMVGRPIEQIYPHTRSGRPADSGAAREPCGAQLALVPA
jgi:hypothetical protein